MRDGGDARFEARQGADARFEAGLGAVLVALGGLFVVAPDLVLPRTPCLFHALTDLPCLTCGATRALFALRTLDLETALAMNPLVTLAAIASTLFVPYAAAVTLFGLRPLRPELGRRTLLALRIGLPVVLAANWIYLLAAGR